jgi:hypothetical protein
LHKKLISILLTVALVGGLVSVAAAPALANHTGDGPPPASLLPDDDGIPALEGTVLSDRDDGTDTATHLTAIAPSFTDQVEWRRCNVAIAPPIDNADIAACSVILGTDTSGVPLGEGGGFPPVTPDLAFDLEYDITAADEANSPADIITLACSGSGRTLTNCVVNLDEVINMDDASSGLPGTASTSGEMVSLCTALPQTDCLYDNNQNGTIEPGENGETAAGRAAVDARFVDWNHGDPVPNDGLTIRATTSPDLNTFGALNGFRDYSGTVSADDEGDLPAVWDEPDCAIVATNAQRSIHECVFPDAGGADDDVVQKVAIFNQVGGQGECAAILCILDAHAAASQARAPAVVTARFVPGVTDTNAAVTYDDLEQVDAGSTCASPDAADTNSLGSRSRVRGCVQDQFGQAFTPAQVTFESAGVAALANPSATSTPADGACASLTDTDTDGENDRCEKAVADATNAFAQYGVDLTNVVEPGTQTVTFCPDEDDNGCADETVSATVTKGWEAIADTVFLTYNGTATDTSTPFLTCTTGDTFRENETGDTDDLLACTFDAVGLPSPVAASTDKPGGGRLQWFITPSGGGELTATRFVGTPPRETGADGTAIATLEAFRGGNDLIEVELQNDLGNEVNDAVVQKRVTQTGKPRVESRIGIRGKFRGKVRSPRNACERRRTVVLKKRRPGPDRTVGRDRTNRKGVWRIRKPNARGRFYARVQRQEKRRVICLGDRSKTVRRR